MTTVSACIRTTRFERGLMGLAARLERLAVVNAARRAERVASRGPAFDERAARRRADAMAAAHTGILPR